MASYFLRARVARFHAGALLFALMPLPPVLDAQMVLAKHLPLHARPRAAKALPRTCGLRLRPCPSRRLPALRRAVFSHRVLLLQRLAAHRACRGLPLPHALPPPRLPLAALRAVDMPPVLPLELLPAYRACPAPRLAPAAAPVPPYTAALPRAEHMPAAARREHPPALLARHRLPHHSPRHTRHWSAIIIPTTVSTIPAAAPAAKIASPSFVSIRRPIHPPPSLQASRTRTAAAQLLPPPPPPRSP